MRAVKGLFLALYRKSEFYLGYSLSLVSRKSRKDNAVGAAFAFVFKGKALGYFNYTALGLAKAGKKIKINHFYLPISE